MPKFKQFSTACLIAKTLLDTIAAAVAPGVTPAMVAGIGGKGK
ncbi:MAG: hypothetical protein ABSA09_02810 [Desulfobaccales bacterium]|jgi:hypothetical protein